MNRFARSCTLGLLLVLASGAASAEPATLEDVRFLVGEFEGTGQHPWGEYAETMQSAWTLDDTTLELRTESKMGERTVFSDLRVITLDAATSTLRMRQFSAGLVREYSGAKADNGGLVFTETAHEGPAEDAWRYTFTPAEGGGFAYVVHARARTDGADWREYVSGSVTARLADPSQGGGRGVRQYSTEIDGVKVDVHHPDAAGPFPAIVFSPGGSASTTNGYGPYGRWYATWGYVTVIAAFDDSDAVARAAKFGKVADWLVAENARDGSPLKRLIDTERLAAAGHSRGGFAALVAARKDARFVAAMAFAPSGPPEQVEGPGDARSLVVVAGDDELLPNGRAAFAATPGERVLIEIEGMTHMLAPREQTLRLVERSTAFLEYALRGDARYRPLVRAPAPGLKIETAD